MIKKSISGAWWCSVRTVGARQSWVTLGTFVCTSVCFCAQVHANKGVFVEAADDYSQACNGYPSLPNSVANALGFLGGMVAAPNVLGLENWGGYVDPWPPWAADFYDPETRADHAGDDTNNFDQPGLYASYYAGHGFCPRSYGAGDGNDCTHDSQCSSYTPPEDQRQPGFCARWPGDASGRCVFTSDRVLVMPVCQGNPFNGWVDYTIGYVKWGESSYSGSWAGAGTNGGANLVVLDASCAEMSNRHQEIWPAFAGVHMLATTLVHTGDTQNHPARGGAFASHYQANPYGSVANAWNDTINSLTPYPTCKNRAGTQSYGGGMGFNGCGAHSVTSVGSTASRAHNSVKEGWQNLPYDSNDATGATYLEQWYACNYDCYNYSFNLP